LPPKYLYLYLHTVYLWHHWRHLILANVGM